MKDFLDYAQCCACFRSGEIRILDSGGNVERTLGALRFFLHCAHIMRRRSAPLHDNSRFESAGFTIRREEGHDFVQRNLTID